MSAPQVEGTRPAAARPGTLHMIGNAHIDPVWLWTWQEGFQEIKATYRSALDRLTEDPDFIFTCSSAAHLAWIEANEPEMFAEIRARVHEGRWALVGGWWVQPDCHLPGGEGFARQALYGQRYFHSRFGRTATVGYNPDSFGHAATLPQLLLASGVTRYTFMRPGPHEQALPGRLFWWAAPDGSRVLAFRIPYEYCTWGKDLEAHIRKCASDLASADDRLMCFYGVGNHGGGPTRENLASIHRLSAEPELPALVFSAPDAFFEAADTARAGVWHGELVHHAVGCYSAHSGVKRLNRHAELALVRAEKFATLATTLAALPYPHADLDRAWQRVLFNQFHDILAGTSVESAYDDAAHEYGEALSIAQHVTNAAVQRLSWRVTVPPEDGARSFVVWNPHPWPVRVPVEHEVGGVRDGFTMTDEAGRAVPAQFTRSGATVSGWRRRLAWLADLPAFGHRVFTIRPGTAPDPDVETQTPDPFVLDNAALRVEFDPVSGGIARLLDRRSDSEVFSAPAAVGVVLDDDTDTWSHGRVRFDRVTGQFGHARLSWLERGPLRRAVRSVATYGRSTLTQDYFVYSDPALPVEVRVRVDWHEARQMLKLRFPLHLQFPQVTYEAPYGQVSRPGNGEEYPGGRWVDLSGVHRPTGELRGLGLVNDAKSSYSVTESALHLTVLRSPIYAHHDPYVPAADGDYRYMDQGEQTFTYWLWPHAGTWRDAGLPRLCAALTEGPVALPETVHDGPLPAAQTHASVTPDHVVLSVIKRAQDDRGVVLRLHETHGRPTTAQVSLPFLERELEVDLGAHELVTLLLPDDGSAARRVLLTELELDT
ncbi:alpha-mannosidase [Deinococcus metalli]|uniref:Alpha-mannosidase n=1 Tax=Deinococcus metalli TaxID=1141878 RepID=A0A7W8KH21_9DEIO|nr:alpha-mannosidase [Deinococcus metalli]MBB5377972.1 alpha-mannosidase [Deinococcus metalli]GHF53459.1 alpha-mannosidase [Deinococcus metalli]